MAYKFEKLDSIIQEKILDKQEEQTGVRDRSVFEKNLGATAINGGFNWDDDPEPKKCGIDSSAFWGGVLHTNSLVHFSKVYPIFNTKTTKETSIKFLTKKP